MSRSDAGDALAQDMTPVEVSARIHGLDALRGIALLGILVANVRQMFLPWDVANLPYPADSALAWADWLAFMVLVDLKFLTLFSLLFGIGFALQASRLAARGAGFAGIYLRRVTILAILGGLHAVLLYPAEVLLPYATTALFLLALRGLSVQAMLRGGTLLLGITVFWGFELGTLGHGDLKVTLGGTIVLVALLWAPWTWRTRLIAAAFALLCIGMLLVVRFDPSNGDMSIAADLERARAMTGAIRSDDTAAWPQELQVRRSGDLAGLLGVHVRQYADILLGFAVILLWRTLGLFLIGAGLFRSGLLARAEPALWAHIARLGFVIGLPLSLLAALAQVWEIHAHVDWRWPDFLHGFAALPLAAGIGGAVFLLHGRSGGQPAWTRIEAAGRMALSNYVAQSLVMAALAESWGLGLYARLDGPQLSVLAVAVFAVLAQLSHMWLQRFSMGPLEWLWRCGTYWSWLPNRIGPRAQAGA